MTICIRLCERPQSAEAMVKPVMAMTKNRVRPKRAARKPVGAVMTAAATM